MYDPCTGSTLFIPGWGQQNPSLLQLVWLKTVTATMVRKVKTNHGMRCLGKWRSNEPCKRGGKGGAIWLNRVCDNCQEQRCKKHCRCGRRGETTGYQTASSSVSNAPVPRPADIYAELVEDKFIDWCGNCEYLVCDYERCIRGSLALHALSKTPLKLVEPYPQVSQDFNAIENAWDLLKDRVQETAPTHLEHRDDFIKRLHKAVQWINKYRAARLWELSTNQKTRADECLQTTPPGGRTSW